MTAKTTERQQAITLRKLGLSYSEIQARVPVSQSSLSLWLRAIPLTPVQHQRLAALKLAGGRQGALDRRQAREARVARIMEDAKEEALLRLQSGDLLWLMGTVLYWAEGAKPKPWAVGPQVSFTNMDPVMLRIILRWLRECCGVVEADLRLALYIHPSAELARAKVFWARELPVNAGMQVYFKRPNGRPRRRNTGQSYYGTMRIDVRRSTSLLHRIEGWRAGIALHCGVV